MATITGIGRKVNEDTNYDFKEVIFSDGGIGLLGLPARPDCSKCLAFTNKRDTNNGSLIVVATYSSRNSDGTCSYTPGYDPPCVHVTKCTFNMTLSLSISGIPAGGVGFLIGEGGVFLGIIGNGFYSWSATKQQRCDTDEEIAFSIDSYDSNGSLVGQYHCSIQIICVKCTEINIPD